METKTSHDQRNGAVVLNATLIDRRDMICDSVALVPTEVPVAVETRDEVMRDSGNLSEYEAPPILVLEGAREVHRSKHPSEADRRRHKLGHLVHVLWCTICCRVRTMNDPHHVVTHDESVDSLQKSVCGYVEVKMKGDKNTHESSSCRGLVNWISWSH